MSGPAIVAEFGEGTSPARGAPLVEAAREAGASWVALTAGADLGGVRATVRAASERGLGVFVRLDDTRAIAGLAEACGDLGELSVPGLRDRLVVVVSSELAGRRLRGEARWAPSALALGLPDGSLRRWFRRTFPHHLRGRADCDDVVVRTDLLGILAIGDRLVPEVARRGGRVWVEGARREDLPALTASRVHGVVLSF